jgi:molybdate transport system substrate-binding protein
MQLRRNFVHAIFRTMLLLLACAAPMVLSAQSQRQLTVAAAADLSDPLKEIAVGFQSATGTKLNVIIGSSGNLYTQIQNGAPFDVFMSADTGYPKKLISEGHADGASLFVYGVGSLVLMARADSPLNLRDVASALTGPAVRKVAIANPEHAPYGRAAMEALKSLELYNQVAPKLVVGENVSQAAQFVESGNAQLGLVALARAISPAVRDKVKFVEVPPGAYTPIEQAAVVLEHGKKNPAAANFMQYLRTPASVAVLKKYGFAQPTTAERKNR